MTPLYKAEDRIQKTGDGRKENQKTYLSALTLLTFCLLTSVYLSFYAFSLFLPNSQAMKIEMI
jgi:hypothetical protein